MDSRWPKFFPDLGKICSLFRLSDLYTPQKFQYKPLPSLLQNGPQCGLVALAMCMESPTDATVRILLDNAMMRGFTYNGEMFSVREMAILAKHHLPGSEVEVFEGYLDSERIKTFLLNGGLLLVPYDCDENNAPCLQIGHCAHWAIVSGAIQTKSTFYVLARQGKTKHVSRWKLRELALSNSQLFQFCPYRKLDGFNYRVPKGGMWGPNGLNSKSVLIHKRESTE